MVTPVRQMNQTYPSREGLARDVARTIVEMVATHRGEFRKNWWTRSVVESAAQALTILMFNDALFFDLPAFRRKEHK